jgi:NAD-dependent DNA ligase
MSFTRKDAQKMVKDQGGDAPSSITKSLNFLVIGDGSKVISSKQKKAIKFNEKGSHIQIINESKFLEMIG